MKENFIIASIFFINTRTYRFTYFRSYHVKTKYLFKDKEREREKEKPLCYSIIERKAIKNRFVICYTNHALYPNMTNGEKVHD